MSREKVISSILASEDTCASPLLIVILDQYGTEALQWDPETIRLEIKDDFSIDIPPINIDKIMMASTVVTTDWFYRSLPDFIDACNIFGGSAFDPRIFDPASILECVWGITEAVFLSPPEKEGDPFSDDIKAYIIHTARQEGFVIPPKTLPIKFDLSSSISHLAADPIMFSSAWQNAVLKAEEVDVIVFHRLNTMLRQIEQLPLRHGSPLAVGGTNVPGRGNRAHSSRAPDPARPVL